jgi:molybdate transport system substrate-binding protein
MMMRIQSISRQLFLLAAIGLALTCEATDLSVLSAGAAKSALSEIVERYQMISGNKLNVEYAPVGVLLQRLSGGAKPDVLIVTTDVIGDVEHKGWTVPGTATPVGNVGVGIAVQAQAKTPDISTPDALKQTLLNAKSITYIDPSKGTSGKHFAEVLRRLGIAEQMKAKTTLGDTGYVVEPVARGEIEIGIQQITEILPVKGVKLVGPLPDPLQKTTTYTVALGANATEVAAARNFLAYLAGDNAREVFRQKGFAVP